ncbi:tetratricopeptide repeat protein [Actinokineospora terrae]|uniref:Tetratricopeptide repeat-containing protein n=1 Tax=Actinokineospora terrae TaxID=155974 RepID=A0A1H9KVE8_9PSEU|nr:tetratricopeptide repeat protein [Actinokineospora terrae]SER03038.1 Tetratricopeptide repeat-containing protein [Actinokineospora terrae]
MTDGNHLDGDVSGTSAQIGVVHGPVSFGAQRSVEGLPYRSGAVPVVVDGFQPRSVPELESLVTGGVVLSGMGGVGKTQTAADYANRVRDVDLLGWVTAASRSNLLSGLAELAAIVFGSAIDDPERAAKRFLDWCATTSRKWLLVLDDVSDPAEVKDLWPNTGTSGRLVVTTRRHEKWVLQAKSRRMVPLDVFTEAESADYLRGVLGDVSGVEDLAALLGRLPLALSQAAALIDMTPGMTCESYIDNWRTRRASLAELFPEDWSGPGDQIATTWAVSINAADALPPAQVARPMLEVMSLLDPNGIPLSVLTSQPILDYLSVANADLAARALGALQRLNLITVTDTTARIHALVQHATRDQLSDDQLALLAHAAADALMASWPDIERDTKYAATLRTNTNALADNSGQHLWQPDGHIVLFHAGESLGEAGLVHAAVAHFENLGSAAHHYFSPDHLDTLAIRHNVARWRGEAGDAAGAAHALAELLDDYLRVLGPDHPDTLITHHNLAYWRGEAGDPAGAAQTLTELLNHHLRVLGPDHPHTLTTRHNLARWQASADDVSGAAQALAELLDDYLRVLGPDHPDTLTTRHNLARVRGEAGDAAGAAQALAELLDDNLRVLGPDHPHTLTTRHNLANWRGEAGDPAGAAQTLTELLDDRVRILGIDHPHTLLTFKNVAYWRRRTRVDGEG